MNEIVKPLTPDGMVGWDSYGQLCFWKVDGNGRKGWLIGDPRGHKCRICQQGWILTAESLEDQSYWDFFGEWVHKSCSIRYSGLKERDMWHRLLIEAEFRFEALRELPNEYWRNDEWYGKKPWYRAKLLDTERTLKLGTRKRVFHMEIEEGRNPYDQAVAKELLGGETSTKEISGTSLYIHAWSEPKALEYLKAFKEILCLNKKGASQEARA